MVLYAKQHNLSVFETRSVDKLRCKMISLPLFNKRLKELKTITIFVLKLVNNRSDTGSSKLWMFILISQLKSRIL